MLPVVVPEPRCRFEGLANRLAAQFEPGILACRQKLARLLLFQSGASERCRGVGAEKRTLSIPPYRYLRRQSLEPLG